MILFNFYFVILSEQLCMRIRVNHLKSFVKQCLEYSGSNSENASISADVLVEADLRGVHSHGVNRLQMYMEELENGVVNGKASAEVIDNDKSQKLAVCSVNGNNAPGPSIGVYSMNLAIKKAKEFGIGLVSTNHSNHYGIAGYYSMMASEQSMIGISCTNTSPILVPTRSKKVALGTNPIAFTGPKEKSITNMDKDLPITLKTKGFQLDMATTSVALGKVEYANRKNESIPSGWAVDGNGENCCDPNKVLENGGLYPLGGEECNSGYKGYGLAMMVEMMCGILGNSKYGTDIDPWNKGRLTEANLGQCFVAIDPNKFGIGYEEREQDLIKQMKDLPLVSGENEILTHGEKEIKIAKEQNEKGIFIHQNLLDNLNNIAKRIQIPQLK